MMDLMSLLVAGVGAPAAIQLLKWYLKGDDVADIPVDLGEEIGKSLIKIVSEKIKDVLTQNKAKREFEALGEKIATKLLPLFEESVKRGDCDAKKVIDELQFTLGTKPTPGLLVRENLDPDRIAAELRARHHIDATRFTTTERELYEMSLDQSVRHLVNLAAALPKFELAVAKESLERLSRIGSDLDQVLETVQRIEQSVVKDSADEFARYEADYRQAVIRKLDYLELFGADIPPEARSHSLTVAYVSLNLQREGASEDETTSLPVEEVLDELGPDSGRLLIRGEAGSGKSTLFRWASIKAAQLNVLEIKFKDQLLWRLDRDDRRKDKLPPRSWQTPEGDIDGDPESWWDYHIPFLIRLRDFTDGKLPAPDKFPELVAKEIGNPPAEWVLSVLKAGRALVLLDGVDEIPGAMRETLKREIKAIIDAYPDNYYLVSTRPRAVDEGWLASEQFREATVNPMSDRDKAELIDKWHQAVGEELRRRGAHDPKLDGMAERLKAKLRETPSINLLAKYPLLASMICAFHRRNDEHLPASEVELVERLCFMLLDDRDRLSGLRNEALPDDYSKLEYPHKKLIAQDLAYHMLVHKGESSLSRSEALDQVRERLARLGKPGDPKVVLDAIVERSGMLREPIADRIDFLHNAFKEYLTALRLVEENADGLLAGHWNDAEWLPVILYAAATSKQGFATELIKKMLSTGWFDRLMGRDPMSPVKAASRQSKPTDVDRELRRRQVIALQCRNVALDLDPELQKVLDKQRYALFPPQTLTDAEALASAGDLAVEGLRFHGGYPAKERAACVRALRLIDTPKSRSALNDYLTDSNLNVVEELANAVDPLTIPAVMAWTQQSLRPSEKESQLAVRRLITNVQHFFQNHTVETIDLESTAVSDIGPLRECVALRHLSLRGTKVTDLSLLSQLKHLRHVDISNTTVTNLAPLCELPELSKLILPDGMIPIAQLSTFENDRRACGLAQVELSGRSREEHLQALELQRIKWEEEKRRREAEEERRIDRTDRWTMRCFVSGTLIHTQSGVKPIESIVSGEFISSWNEELHRLETCRVTNCVSNKRHDLVLLNGINWSVTCSANHPFLTSDGTWLKAEEVCPGVLLATGESSSEQVVSIQLATEGTFQTVYNLEVEKTHTYRVTEVGLIVHNTKIG